MSQDNTAGLTLAAVIADFSHLPASPDVVMKLLDYLREDEVEADVVARMIAKDQVLAAKSLRIANSSFYALQRRVATIQEAVVVLGQRTVSTMVSAMAITSRFQALQVAGYDQKMFWMHSVGTGLCARALAQRLRLNQESAFTAGLLHDIGMLVLATRFPADFAHVLEYRNAKDSRMIDAERQILGFDHTQIGAALAREWKFAHDIGEAVGGHHHPEQLGEKSLANLIHVADLMAHVLGFASGANDLAPRLDEAAWQRLGLAWSDFRALMAEVDAQRGDAGLFFN